MLVSFKTVLDMAEKGNFAIPAFNVYNMETVMGCIEAVVNAAIVPSVYLMTKKYALGVCLK